MRPPPPINSPPPQIRRTSVGSTSRYSANPPQTPAIFWSVRERDSFLADLTGGCISVPHWEQKLTAWEYSFPHFGQNMATPPFFVGNHPTFNYTRSALGKFRLNGRPHRSYGSPPQPNTMKPFSPAVISGKMQVIGPRGSSFLEMGG